MKNIVAFAGEISMLMSVIMTAFFERTGVAIALLAVGAGLTVMAIWMEDREEKRQREEARAERLRKYQRRYQGDDLDDVG